MGMRWCAGANGIVWCAVTVYRCTAVVLQQYCIQCNAQLNCNVKLYCNVQLFLWSYVHGGFLRKSVRSCVGLEGQGQGVGAYKEAGGKFSSWWSTRAWAR